MGIILIVIELIFTSNAKENFGMIRWLFLPVSFVLMLMSCGVAIANPHSSIRRYTCEELTACPHPLSDPKSWIANDDYVGPRENISSVRFAIVVGPKGEVQSCLIESSSGSAAFDRAMYNGVCKHAAFLPVQDNFQRPATGKVVLIVWP